MKLTDLQRRLILLAIGLIYIILGVVQGLLKVKLDQNLIGQIGFVLLIIALWVFMGNRNAARNQKSEKDTPPKQDEEKK